MTPSLLEVYEPIEDWLYDWTLERKLLGQQAEREL